MFIVGAPRTGSTLQFQLMIASFRVAYLTNLQSLFSASPVTIGKLSPRRGRKTQSDAALESHYGYVAGLHAPSEAGLLFAEWFGAEGSADPSHVRRTVAALSSHAGGPLLSKNLNNSLRLQRITEILPDSFVIVIERDPVAVCSSLLTMRRDVLGSVHEWASVKPEGWDQQVDREPEHQVAWQVTEIYRRIDEALGANPSHIRIRYEDLVRDPNSVLCSVARAYERATSRPLHREAQAIPSLRESRPAQVSEDTTANLKAALSAQGWKV